MNQPSYKMPHWFCVHAKPMRELQAVLSLRNPPAHVQQNVGDVEVYFPRIQTRMAVAGLSRRVTRPLFPRYFFARFVWEKAARFIASRPQVIAIVQFGELPTVIPSGVIEELRRWSAENDAEIFDPTSQLMPGQRVVIQGGPFKGMEGEFIMHLSDRKRVSLLMDHLQNQPRLMLDRSLLKPVF